MLEKTKIGDFLCERKGRYKPDDDVIAGLMRINKIDFSGNFHIVQKNSNTDMIMVCPGDLVISGINVAKGAMGIYYGDENVTATIHYSSYTFDTGKIDVKYFKRFLKSAEFIRLLNEQVKGGIKTEIKPKHLLSLEIELPDIDEQKQKTQHFKSVESEDTELKQEITHQQTLLKKLRQQILQEAIEGKLTTDWRTKNSSPAKGRCPEGAEGLGAEGLGPEGLGPEGLNPHQGISTRSGAMVKSKRIFTLPHLTTFRKSLRKNLTPAEAKLWTLLKGKQLQGRKFRRQHSVANYILDFYCPAEKLAIELDGEGHNNLQITKQDEERGIFLEHTGVKVLRFENKAVFESPEGVLAMIEQAFNSSGPDPSGPDPSAPSGHLPLAGEEFETAGMLLERIRVEKERLMGLGEIKRQKPLPPIKDEEKLFELPEGWEWCRLGDIISILGDGIHGTPVFSNSGEYFFVNGNNLNNGKIVIKESTKKTTKSEYEKYYKNLSDKTILVSINGTLGNIAFYRGEKIVLGKSACYFNLLNGIDIFYIKRFIESKHFMDYALYMASEVTIKNLSLKSMRHMLVPFPPLSEQKVIVDKVEILLACCDQLETQITENQTHAKALMQAVLKEAFSYD